jgi:O-antigen ligase
MNRPILGIGTGMTAHALAATTKPHKGKQEFSTNAGHAHNIFLQTWYELGVVGAIFLSLFGLGLLDAIKHLKPRHQPAALAVFAASFATASTSFGLWQSWFMSMFGLTLLSFVLAVKADPGHEAPPDRQ